MVLEKLKMLAQSSQLWLCKHLSIVSLKKFYRVKDAVRALDPEYGMENECTATYRLTQEDPRLI